MLLVFIRTYRDYTYNSREYFCTNVTLFSLKKSIDIYNYGFLSLVTAHVFSITQVLYKSININIL